MKILSADFIYTADGFLKNHAIAFTKTIEAIGTLNELTDKYPNVEIVHCKPNSVIYPGFINTHVHLEFSANKTSLKYGSFMPWLDSVIEHRDELMGCCNNSIMTNACQEMLHSGITTFGAISSFGNELEVCEKTPQRVVFFNELIGSNAQYADMLYNDFLERVKSSQSCKESSLITPAIAIHSPYSVHPIILQKAVNIAKQNNLPLSSHFLESKAERQWLENGEGELKSFFKKYFNTSTPVTNIEEFMHAFDSYPTQFTHAVHATEDELKSLAKKGHTITHCPRSNRYLGCGRLKVEKLKDIGISYSLATDGLSSNDSLNIFDELRAGLILHNEVPIEELSKDLIDAVTKNAADALSLNSGRIEVGKMSDFAIVQLKEEPTRENEITLWTILHTKKVSEVYIDGEKVC